MNVFVAFSLMFNTWCLQQRNQDRSERVSRILVYSLSTLKISSFWRLGFVGCVRASPGVSVGHSNINDFFICTLLPDLVWMYIPGCRRLPVPFSLPYLKYFLPETQGYGLQGYFVQPTPGGWMFPPWPFVVRLAASFWGIVVMIWTSVCTSILCSVWIYLIGWSLGGGVHLWQSESWSVRAGCKIDRYFTK